MRRQFVAQVARCAHAAIGAGLAQLAQFADQQVDLLLLAHDDFVELIELVFGEAGLDFQLGQALVGVATAAMDVSDGVLIDASRLAAASGLAVTVDLAALPLSPAAAARTPATDAALLDRATAGDDYELLFAVPPGAVLPQSRVPLTRIGHFTTGEGLAVTGTGGARITPGRLGWEHGRDRP